MQRLLGLEPVPGQQPALVPVPVLVLEPEPGPGPGRELAPELERVLERGLGLEPEPEQQLGLGRRGERDYGRGERDILGDVAFGGRCFLRGSVGSICIERTGTGGKKGKLVRYGM